MKVKFNYLRKILSLIMLLIYSYEDIKTREINDKIWIIFSQIGIIITLFFLDPINLNKNIIHPFNSIIVLTNSCIISLIIPFSIFIYNLYRILNKEKIFEGFENEKIYRKIFALFIGYRTKKIKKRYATSIEKKINNKKKFVFLY
ncbi:MAG: hypothetical protein QXP60_05455 [Nitrososphaerota archaeon]